MSRIGCGTRGTTLPGNGRGVFDRVTPKLGLTTNDGASAGSLPLQISTIIVPRSRRKAVIGLKNAAGGFGSIYAGLPSNHGDEA